MNVGLRYTNGTYQVARDLMHKPAPTEEALQAEVQHIRTEESWSEEERGEMWSYMLDLLYSGHEDLGWRFYDMATMYRLGTYSIVNWPSRVGLRIRDRDSDTAP